MSASNETRKYEMPSHLRLGPDKDGNIFVEKWTGEMYTYSASFFDDLTECFQDNEPRDWMDKDAKFQYYKRSVSTSGSVVLKKAAFPKAEDPDYEDAKDEKEVWKDKKKRFEQKAPAIITFMLNGTMCNESRERLLRVIDQGNSTVLKDIRRTNDILALRSQMISIHDYKGMTIEKKDKDAAEKAMVDLKVSKFRTGQTIAEHKRHYDEIIRKLTSFKLIGNSDPKLDRFNQEYLFEAFFDPMENHDNQRIKNRLQSIDEKTLDVDKSSLVDFEREYKEFVRLEGKTSSAGKQRGGNDSVLTVNGSDKKAGKRGDRNRGSVNSAVSNVRKALNNKNNNKKDNDKKGLFLSEEKTPESYAKTKKIAEKLNISFGEARQTYSCNTCGEKGHLAINCPEGPVKSDHNRATELHHLKKSARKDKKKKKVTWKKGSVNHARSDAEDSDESDEEYQSAGSDGFQFVICGECSSCSSEDEDFVPSKEKNSMAVKKLIDGVESNKDIIVSDIVNTSSMVENTLAINSNTIAIGDITVEDVDSDSNEDNNLDQISANLKDIRTKIARSDGGSTEGVSSNSRKSSGYWFQSSNQVRVSSSEKPKLVSESSTSEDIYKDMPGLEEMEPDSSDEEIPKKKSQLHLDIPALQSDSDTSDDENRKKRSDIYEDMPDLCGSDNEEPRRRFIECDSESTDSSHPKCRIEINDALFDSERRVFSHEEWDEVFSQLSSLEIDCLLEEMGVYCADREKKSDGKDSESDEDNIERRIRLARQADSFYGLEQELNAVHFDDSDEEERYLDYIVERSRRERELRRDAAAVQQQERERVAKEIAEGRVPTVSTMENQINFMVYRRRTGDNITFEEWQERQEGAKEVKTDSSVNPPEDPPVDPPTDPPEDPPSDPPEIPPVESIPSTVPQGEETSSDPEPKRTRFGFVEIDGRFNFVDEDLILSTLEFDKQYRECEEYVKVNELSDSDSEECEREYNASCYMAKMQKSLLKSKRLDEVEETMKYCIDGMANVNVIKNPNVLRNIRTSPKSMNIKGVGGKTITIDQIGDHPLFGKCWYYPSNEFNIISQWKANQKGLMFRVSDDNEQAWLVRDDGISICFNRDPKDHFYKCPIDSVDELIRELDALEINRESVNLNAEDYAGNLDEIYGEGQQRMLYTEEQVRRAEIAEAMHISFEHCSDQQLKTFIESPSTINCPITFNDVKNLRAIKGPCRVCLEGKPKPNKGSHSTNDPYVPQHAGEMLHCDIVYVKGKPRLFAIDHVSGYCSFIVMESKSVPDLTKAFEEILNAYQSYMKVVKVISVDGESNLKACKGFLNSRGVRLESRIPGEHEKFAERAMRVVRERIRVKLIELPYALPRSLHDSLAAEVVRTMNMLPNSRSFPLSPKSMVRGEQTNVQADIAPPFGSAVLCPVASSIHSTEQKQEIGVAMGSNDGTRAGVKVYLLNQRLPVVRRALKPMPMVQSIIDHMNEYASVTTEFKKDPDEDQDGGADAFRYTETLGKDFYPGEAEDFYRGDNVDDKLIPPKLSKTMIDIDYSVNTPKKSQETVQLDSSNQEGVKVDQHPVEPIHVEESVESVPIPIPVSPVKLKSTYKPPKEERLPTRSSARIAAKSANVINLERKEGMVFQMTLTRALASEHSDAAKEAAKKELKQLIDTKTWVYLRDEKDASKSVHTKETPSSMFLKPKYDARGTFLLWKARLVDGGHMTDPLRYEPMEKTAPTTTLEVVMALLAIARAKKYSIEGFDVPSAYLNASLKPGRFHKMRIGKKISNLLVQVDKTAQQYLMKDGTLLVEIRKSLYGLPEAAQLWYEYLSGALRNGGYTSCPYDPCLFIRRKGSDVSMIGIYVDDCLHIYKGEGMKRDLYAALRDANLQGLKVEELKPGSPISFLGLNIMRSKENMDIKVNQFGYLANILEEYEEDFENLRPQPNPSDENVFRPNYSEGDLEPVPMSNHLSKLMKIRYLVRTRPDIELTCAALCTRSRNPTKGDEKYLNKLLKYLSDTKLHGIIIKETDLQLIVWFDAGFGIHIDRKSHSGHLVCFGDTGIRVPIHWRSIKQKVVATSSSEAELIAMYEGLDFLIWFKRVLEFLGIPQKTIRVFQDNTSTITMVFFGRGSSGSMTRHIDIKYFFTKQFIDDLTFVIEHLPRENMMADFFASPRTGQSFRRMRDILMRGV